MTPSATSAQALATATRGDKVPQWRQHVLRAVALFFVVAGSFSIPRMLIEAVPPTAE